MEASRICIQLLPLRVSLFSPTLYWYRYVWLVVVVINISLSIVLVPWRTKISFVKSWHLISHSDNVPIAGQPLPGIVVHTALRTMARLVIVQFVTPAR